VTRCAPSSLLSGQLWIIAAGPQLRLSIDPEGSAYTASSIGMFGNIPPPAKVPTRSSRDAESARSGGSARGLKSVDQTILYTCHETFDAALVETSTGESKSLSRKRLRASITSWACRHNSVLCFIESVVIAQLAVLDHHMQRRRRRSF
jgi:hypothetical protein